MLRSGHLPDGPCQAPVYPCPDSSWPRATLALLPSSAVLCPRSSLRGPSSSVFSSALPGTGVPSWFPTPLGNGAVDL
jgi:hypothetical protein